MDEARPYRLEMGHRTCAKLQSLAEKQEKWRTAIGKATVKRALAKRAEELESVPSIDSIQEMLNSHHATELRARYRHATAQFTIRKAMVDESDAVDMRNFMVVLLSSVNAGRPSLMENLTTAQVEKATLKNDVYSVPVADHKTSAARGIAFLQWPRSMDYIVRTYLDAVRPVLIKGVSEPSNMFLVNSTGSASTSSQFHRYLESFAKSCGFKGRLTNTMIRKSVVTELYRDASEEFIGEVATKMMHDRRTGKRYYDTASNEGTSSRVTSLLAKRLDLDDQDWVPEDAPEESSEDEEVKESSTERSVRPEPKLTGEWDKRDVGVLNKAFQILLGKPNWPKKKDIRKVYTTSPSALEIWSRCKTEAHKNRCIEKIRNMYKKKRKEKKN